MERRDIIKDEIEALGKVLGKILAQILGTEGKADNEYHGPKEIAAALKQDVSIDLPELLQMPYDGIKPYLKTCGFQPVHLQSLSDILLASAKKAEADDPELAHQLYSRTLDLFQLMDETLQTTSFDRFQTEQWIRDKIAGNR